MIWQNSEVIIYFYFSFLFLFGLITQGRSVGKYHMTMSQSQSQSHDEHGKIVHRPYGSYISSIQNLNKNSIKFSLSTQTWNGLKSSWPKSYI